MNKNALSWFEIPVKDFEGAKLFYQTIFNFDMPVMEMGKNRFGILLHDREAGVGGAIVAGEWYEPSFSGVLIYLNADPDLGVVLDRVPDAGGEVLVPKTDIGQGMGFFAIFKDVAGNRVGLHSKK